MQGRVEEALSSFEALIAASATAIEPRILVAELYSRNPATTHRAVDLLREAQRIPAITPGRIPNVGFSSNSGMRASRRLAPLSEASQTNQGITDSTDQTDSTDRSLTPTLPLRHEPGQIFLNDLRMLSGTRRATERDGCAVVKDVVRARWTWSAAGRGTIRGIRLIGQIRIPLVLLAATRVIRSILFDTTPTDATTFIAVPIVLTLAAIVASYLSARRAAKTDPMVAIKGE